MKKLRIFAVMVLCVSLLAFAGCGDDNANDNADNGTVVEDTTNTNDNNDNNDNNGNDDSLGGDMVDDAKDAADDVRDDAENLGESRDTDEEQKKNAGN